MGRADNPMREHNLRPPLPKKLMTMDCQFNGHILISIPESFDYYYL